MTQIQLYIEKKGNDFLIVDFANEHDFTLFRTMRNPQNTINNSDDFIPSMLMIENCKLRKREGSIILVPVEELAKLNWQDVDSISIHCETKDGEQFAKMVRKSR